MSAPDELECWVIDHPEGCDCGVDPDAVYERGLDL